jgi:hypothetical protein
VRRTLPWAVALVGLVLVAGGVVLFAVGNQPAGFGWSAYGPMPPHAYRSDLHLTFDDGAAVLWTRTSALGAGVALLGLLALTGLGGWLAGLRAAGRRAD